MSDIEIYNALSCCLVKLCSECPYKKYTTYGCKTLLLKDTTHNFGRLLREANEMRKRLKQQS